MDRTGSTPNADDSRESGRLVTKIVTEGGAGSTARWLGLHQKWLCDDAARMNRIEERLRQLERGGVIRRFFRWWL